MRELENILYRLLVLASGDVIECDHVLMELPRAEQAAERAPSLEASARQHIDAYFSAHLPDLPPMNLFACILPLVERPLIERTLEATEGNRLRAAELLGINRNTLRKKMQELGIVWE